MARNSGGSSDTSENSFLILLYVLLGAIMFAVVGMIFKKRSSAALYPPTLNSTSARF